MPIPEHLFQQSGTYFTDHFGEAGLRIYIAVFGVGLILLSIFAPYRTDYVPYMLGGVAAYISLP